MKVSKKERARRKAQFHIYMKMAKLHDVEPVFFIEVQDHLRRSVFTHIPSSYNGHGEPMAFCSDAAKYFGVSTRSMQRLYTAYFGPITGDKSHRP